MIGAVDRTEMRDLGAAIEVVPVGMRRGLGVVPGACRAVGTSNIPHDSRAHFQPTGEVLALSDRP